jgi:hypothetical protein
METTREDRMSIIDQKIRLIANSIYDCTIDVRVAKNCKDEAMEKGAVERMKKLEKMLDEYTKIKSEEKAD